jgi:hypothetical protein
VLKYLVHFGVSKPIAYDLGTYTVLFLFHFFQIKDLGFSYHSNPGHQEGVIPDYSFHVLITINPIKAESMPKKIAITRGARGDCVTISVRIRSQRKPLSSQTGMTYATTKAPKNPIIDPRILFFLSLKITYKIRSEILTGINSKNSGNAIAYPNPSSILFISLMPFLKLFYPLLFHLCLVSETGF